MRRRAFLTAAAALVAPRASAQAPPLIGVLSPIRPTEFAVNLEAFRQGLREGGLVEGAGVRLALRYSEGMPERLPALAAELVALGPRVIVAGATAGALAAARATREIPIVFVGVNEDPVALGLVESLARPGRNVTGLTLADDLGLIGKRLEILKEAVPAIRRVAAVINPNDANDAGIMALLPAAAAATGLSVAIVPVHDRDGLAEAFAQAGERGDALYVALSPMFMTHRVEVTALAARLRRPAVYGFREFAAVGGLIAYGPSLVDLWRGATPYVDRILKGERPATPPVQQPTSLRLVVNLNAARALGLEIPPAVLARADEVIE